MPIITIFSANFCEMDSVVDEVIKGIGFKHITDDEVAIEAGRRSSVPDSKIKRAFSTKTSVFNKYTREKERSIAYIKLAVAKLAIEGKALMTNFCGMLIPDTVEHVLRVSLVASKKYRIKAAIKQQGISKKEAERMVKKSDEQCAGWIETIWGNKDPWDPALYDIVIPVDKMTVAQAAALITENAGKDILQPDTESKMALENFRLAAEVEVALVQAGHTVDVNAHKGHIILTINQNVLRLNRLQEELKSIADSISGVKSVETKTGKGFHQSDIYRKHDFEMPSKVLLVDDEREFVQTLSERLIMRNMGSAVAYDGESALELIKEDDPEVIIVDLKMPGVDGIEVLRKVKETRPEIEVIIVTGHGHEEDRQLCMDLGAFAYLQKPLDINVLSETIQKANEKVQQRKGQTD